jgi:hypothetical protein
VLASVIEQAAHGFQKRSAKSKTSSTAYSNRKMAAALRVEADELSRYSKSDIAKSGQLDPVLLGYLSAFCYGHLQVTEYIHVYLIGQGFTDIASSLAAIAEPFQERSMYVLTALEAHTKSNP